MSHGQYDTTRLQQIEHDTKLFEETMNFLQAMEKSPLGKKLYGSQNPSKSQSEITEVLCDYFKDATFSRG